MSGTVDRPGTTTARTRPHRRPSGEPPPLPRRRESASFWIAIGLVAVAFLFLSLPIGPAGAAVKRINGAIIDGIARLRSHGLNVLMKGLQALGSRWVIGVLRLGTLVVLASFRKWRRLLTFLGSVLAVGGITFNVPLGPLFHGVRILGTWQGFSNPSRPVAVLTVTLVGMGFALIPAGRRRRGWFWGAAAITTLFAFSQLYIGLDTPTDLAFAASLGVAVPMLAFWLFCPDKAFPVTYRVGDTAHLDLGGRRGDAIRRAVKDQLGITVETVEPFGLTGSGASSPMRLDTQDPPGMLFAKLTASVHLRSDRCYKIGRSILYGRLEDERPFVTVKQLVEYEDYMLRLMRDGGLPTPTPYGVVVITPGREYLLVTELFGAAQELREAVVDEGIIDDGLGIVRKLWDSGLAHRDIKPSNLMVRDGKVLLIDVGFAELRPTPWREAVDLANMMLCLALHSDSDTVYRRALLQFEPQDVAEGFAATHSVTMPTELRTLMHQDGRDLVAEFRRLAPTTPPVNIQRWSVRRVLYAAAAVVTAVVLLTVGVENVISSGFF